MNTKLIEFHEGAAADVKNAVVWYRSRSRKAAADFVKEPQRAATTIRDAPGRWPSERNNTRRFLLWRFPFTVIYSNDQLTVTIWAVAHASRRPDYWAGRIRDGK
jgi:toxin ParE1/3/4